MWNQATRKRTTFKIIVSCISMIISFCLTHAQAQSLTPEEIKAFNKKAAEITNIVNLDRNGIEIDQNKAKSWSLEFEANTYPTDLTRVITIDKPIQAMLKTRIVSSLPGIVILMIHKPVYAMQGTNILIPAGSIATGKYNPVTKVGEERLLLIIDRIRKPDGDLIILKKKGITTDAQGATGIPGEVDNRYFERFVPMLFSIVNNNINPIITIETGTEITIFAQQDIQFKPNRNVQEIKWK